MRPAVFPMSVLVCVALVKVLNFFICTKIIIEILCRKTNKNCKRLESVACWFLDITDIWNEDMGNEYCYTCLFKVVGELPTDLKPLTYLVLNL